MNDKLDSNIPLNSKSAPNISRLAPIALTSIQFNNLPDRRTEDVQQIVVFKFVALATFHKETG